MGHAVCSPLCCSQEQKLFCLRCLRAVCHVPMFGALCSTCSPSHTDRKKKEKTEQQEKKKEKKIKRLHPCPLQSCHVNSRLLFNLHFEAPAHQPPLLLLPPPVPPAPSPSHCPPANGATPPHQLAVIKNAEFKLISDIWPFVKLFPSRRGPLLSSEASQPRRRHGCISAV